MCDNLSQIIKSHFSALFNLLLKVYLGAFIATSIALCVGYVLAGRPEHIPWMKLIPTLLIALPVYGSRSPGIQTWSNSSLPERMDALCFKTIYIVGITWLAWDIFRGII